MIRRPPRSTPLYSSAASDVYKRQDIGGHGVSCRVIGTHGSGGVCYSDALDRARVISRDPLVLDCRHVIHAEYLTRVATTVTKLPTHFRVVSNLIHQLNHAPGISPVEEATLHGHGKRVSHLNGIHAHVVAEAVHLCDGLYVPVVTVSAQRPYTLVFDPGRYVIPILIVIDVGAVDHTTGHAAVFPLSSPILAVL